MSDLPTPILTFRPMGIDKISALLAENAERSPLKPISLAFGQSDFPIHKYVDLSLPTAEVETLLGYGDICGQASLRNKISHFYTSTFDVDIPPRQILITDGATGALVLTVTFSHR